MLMSIAAILIVFVAGVLVGRRMSFERGYAKAEEVAHGQLMDRLMSGELMLGSLVRKAWEEKLGRLVRLGLLRGPSFAPEGDSEGAAQDAAEVKSVIVKGQVSPLCQPVVITSIKPAAPNGRPINGCN